MLIQLVLNNNLHNTSLLIYTIDISSRPINWHTAGQILDGTATTRWHILKLKCTKFDFGWGSAPDPAVKHTAIPKTP